MKDQTRNLNPTPEAVVAMWLYGSLYAESRKGSMDFWDDLDDYRKRQCQRLLEDVEVARDRHAPKRAAVRRG